VKNDQDKILRITWWVLAVAVFSLTTGVRIRLLGIPLERDEGEYAYAGQLFLQGIPPYKLAYSMKLPGTYVGLRDYDVFFSDNNHRNPSGAIVREQRNQRAHLFHRKTTA